MLVKTGIKYADLHLHTKFSDGTATVEELIRETMTTDLAAIAITDHDSVEAIEIALQLTRGTDLKVISGVELSSVYRNKDVHILGYCIDHHNPDLLAYCQRFRKERENRAVKIVENLRAIGVVLSMDRVYELSGAGAIGRPHLARVMVENNIVSDKQEAFDRYLGYDSPAYVHKYRIQPAKAINIIHQAGGLAVLAHASTIKDDSIITFLVKDGLDGLEVYHPQHMMLGCAEFYKRQAEKYGLLITGGSDWHGSGTTNDWIGKAQVSMNHVERMEAKAAKLKNSLIANR